MLTLVPKAQVPFPRPLKSFKSLLTSSLHALSIKLPSLSFSISISPPCALESEAKASLENAYDSLNQLKNHTLAYHHVPNVELGCTQQRIHYRDSNFYFFLEFLSQIAFAITRADECLPKILTEIICIVSR